MNQCFNLLKLLKMKNVNFILPALFVIIAGVTFSCGGALIKVLRGMFTGSETGSMKNDAYRWAVREYLSKGLCSGHLLCLNEDPYSTRVKGIK